MRFSGGRLGAPLVLLVAALALGCLSPDRRREILTLLIDGYPGSKQGEPVVGTDETEPSARSIDERGPVEVELVFHDPYAGKECEECHDGAAGNQVWSADDELCWNCHEPEEFPGENQHEPMADGECVTCHSPHKSPYEYLLVVGEPDLCEKCHDSDSFPGLEEHIDSDGESCSECHDPHASDWDYLLREDPEE